MTTDITELAQSNELLIANGNETANLLRHLANNEIDSDYFAVVSECESYGKETDAELSITEFARRAAGYVDALVEALEKAQQRNVELETYSKTALEFREAARDENRHLKLELEIAENRIADLESRTVTVKLPEVERPIDGTGYAKAAGAQYYKECVIKVLTAQGIKWEAE